ncbi:MAG: hypothetical protein HYY78_18210 [Betaproteobacteria bacterium]|nr:hypothetical protein [Betaproteobacteria bacterium]
MLRSRDLAVVAIAMGMFGYTASALALTCQSNANGNWNAAGTWTTCGGGIPGAGDDVQIRNANTVTIPAGYAAAANSVTFTVSNGTANLTHAAATSTITVGAGGATINSPGNNNSKNWNINAGSATVNGALSMNGGGNNSRFASIVITTGSLDVNGGVTMTAANAVRTVIDMSGGAGNLFIAGSFSLASGNGTLTPGTTSTVTYDSATTPVTVATGSSIAYNHLVIAKGAGNVADAATTGTLTVGGNLTVTSGTFNIPGITATITGTTSVTGTLGFITAATGTKTFSGAVTVNAGGTWSNAVNANVTLGNGLTNDGTFGAGDGAYTLTGSLTNGDTFNAGTGNFSLTGNFTNNGTFNSSTGTFTFNGGAAQSVSGSSGATGFANLALNNANGLSLAGTHDVTVSTLLTLTSGRITTNANVIAISNGSNVTGAGANNFINGNLRKTVGAGGCTTCNFEIGSETGGVRYTPVTSVAFTGITTGGSVTAGTVAAEHPNISTSGLDDTLDVNRYWTLANSGVVFTDYGATFNWVAADLDAGADTTIFEMTRFDPPAPAAGAWSSTVTGTRTATSIQITGVTGFGDFAVGQPLAAAAGIGRFNAYDTTTAAGAVTGFITTKVAGAAFNVDIIAIRNNRKDIDTAFTGTVRVELLDASDNSGAADAATGCRASWAVIQTIAPDPAFVGGDNGRKTIAVTENNAWREARFRISDFPAGKLVGCSTDAFAIRPDTLASFSVSDTDWQTAGTMRTLNDPTFGTTTHKAGRPFSVRATAVNGAGTPATTTNYAGAPTASVTACAGAACTATFGTLTLATTFVAGQLASDIATYGEVGSFNLQLVDSAFAIIDAADGTPADCTATGRHVCSGTIAVGRFVPDHFAVALNTPQFGTACGGGFTYIGQSFSYTTAPQITVAAQDFSNNPTTLYTGGWWRITNTSVAPATQAGRYSAAAGTLDVTGLPATAADPVIVDAGSGSGTLTFGSGTGLLFGRTTPVAPFDADISVAVNVIDADGVAYASNPAGFGAATAGNGISFSAGKPMRFGRLVIRNANGSQLLPLPVLLETQYSNGTAFVTNASDNCTAIAASAAASNVAMSGFTGNLTDTPTCETALSGGGTFSSGRKTFLLAAPGSGNNGSVNLTVNLGSAAALGTTCRSTGDASVADSGANLLFLRGNWTGGAYDQNPGARATFGVYTGAEEVIFIRETF